MSTETGTIRCALYTRKSSEEGLEQSFNSLHAQREACEAYVLSQKHEGWQVIPTEYDDGGFSGGNMERPGLKKLLADIALAKVDTVVVYKVDRLTRSLTDFARIVESFDGKGVSFVSVTQQFNTTTSMGRLTLNVLLSFAQFEREVTGERIRDKIAASKKKGMWMGGIIPLGYDLANHQLVINPIEAETVRRIFTLYLELGSVTALQEHLKHSEIRSKQRISSSTGREFGGMVLSRGTLYHLLSNPVYIGKTLHRGILHPGKHDSIVSLELWTRAAALLKENTVSRRTSNNLPSGRMLQGKLVTENGQMYTPTHATKQGRRYFYYTLVCGQRAAKSSIARLPAAELEKKVLSSLTALLRDSLRMSTHFPDRPLRETKLLVAAAVHQAARLSDGPSEEHVKFVQGVIVKVIISDTNLLIELDGLALAKTLLDSETVVHTPSMIELFEPFTLVRRGSEVRLILANGATDTAEPVPALARAVNQARLWSTWIVQGKVRTLKELAARAGLTRQCTSRILRLAALSPALGYALISGKHPPGLTLAQLTNDLSFNWEQQTLGRAPNAIDTF